MSKNSLITRKVGMTSIIDKDGAVKAVTLLSFEDHIVTAIKTTDKDGYEAIQVGTEETKKNSKSIQGHLKQAKANSKIIREFRIIEGQESELNVGDKLSTDIFKSGDKVDVQGISKGKGWAGTIKRHNFHRGRKTHGGRSYRRVGSIGSMYPQHIFKGKKMAGQMGYEKVTVKRLEVALIDQEHKVIGIYGAVPGPKKTLVIVKEAK